MENTCGAEVDLMFKNRWTFTLYGAWAGARVSFGAICAMVIGI